MPKQEKPMAHLQDFLPPDTYTLVLPLLQKHKVHLTITRARRSVLGDYRHPFAGQAHRISVNSNLNRYAFLITLLHELAHLITFEIHSGKVAAHGKEWKAAFASLLQTFVQQQSFPQDIESALQKSLHNAAASSCADVHLLRTLKKYDAKKEGYFVEELPMGACFKTGDGRTFQRGEKLRKRYKCAEVGTGKMYLFSPVYEVKPLDGRAG